MTINWMLAHKSTFIFTFALISWIFPSAAAPLQEFTSTRYVTSLLVAQNGDLWAGTRGGILRRNRAGKWTKYTQRDGLPENEVRAVSQQNDGSIKVLFSHSAAIWHDEKWMAQAAKVLLPDVAQLPQIIWRNESVQAEWDTLLIGTRRIPLPKSTGTHISALLPREKVLLAAMYGDGIWQFDGENWQRAYPDLPQKAQQITALAVSRDAKVLFVGTRRDGIWIYDGEKWQQYLQPNEPYNNNVQSLISYRKSTFAATLEDGLLEFINGVWRHFGDDVLSSNAPRQMAVFRDELYVRFGNGMIDKYDGERWHQNIFPALPRDKAYAIAADAAKLYIGEWGGWSEWDGKNWQHFLKIPELQGVPVLVLHPTEKSVWIGTQNRGLAQYSGDKLQFFDERQGLPDDWITAITGDDSHLLVGTFVGGLAQTTVDGWKSTFAGENITALVMKNDTIFAATRHGLWKRDNKNAWKKYFYGEISSEVQALLITPRGLWIGARTGIYRVGDI